MECNFIRFDPDPDCFYFNDWSGPHFSKVGSDPFNLNPEPHQWSYHCSAWLNDWLTDWLIIEYGASFNHFLFDILSKLADRSNEQVIEVNQIVPNVNTVFSIMVLDVKQVIILRHLSQSSNYNLYFIKRHLCVWATISENQ